MKKALFIIYLISVFTTAQTIIKEGDFKGESKPISCYYLMEKDKVVISYGSAYVATYHTKIDKIKIFDKNGSESVLYEGDGLMSLQWSKTGNTLKAHNFVSLGNSSKYLYVVDEKATGFRKHSDEDALYHGTYRRFNDKYSFGFLNQKNSHKIDLKTDDLYLVRTDLKTNSVKKIKIEKPISSEYIGKDFAKLINSKDSFMSEIIDDNTFEVITKGLNKNYKWSKIYRRVYDFEGELLSNNSYEVSLEKGAMSKNFYSNSDVRLFSSYGNVNGHYVDPITENVYIYGLYREKHTRNQKYGLKGYYIYKFSKKGELLLKIQNALVDTKKPGFNTASGGLYLFFKLFEGEMFLTIKRMPSRGSVTVGMKTFKTLDEKGLFTHRIVLDDKTGAKEVKESKKRVRTELRFKNDPLFSDVNRSRFIHANFSERSFGKLRFNSAAPEIIEESKIIKDYLIALKPKTPTYVNCVKTKSGIWLVQSDNKKYFKVLYFDNSEL